VIWVDRVALVLTVLAVVVCPLLSRLARALGSTRWSKFFAGAGLDLGKCLRALRGGQ